MGKNRIQKEFYSNGKEGHVYRWGGLKKVPWDMDGNWMVLARINDVKRELQQEAKNLGLYYQDQKIINHLILISLQLLITGKKFVMVEV